MLQLHVEKLLIALSYNTLLRCSALCIEPTEAGVGRVRSTTGLFALRNKAAKNPSSPASIEWTDALSLSTEGLSHNTLMIWLDVQLAKGNETTSCLPQDDSREDETHREDLEANISEDDSGIAQIWFAL